MQEKSRMDSFLDWLSVEDHFWPIVALIVLLLAALSIASGPSRIGPEADSLCAAKADSRIAQTIEFFREHR